MDLRSDSESKSGSEESDPNLPDYEESSKDEEPADDGSEAPPPPGKELTAKPAKTVATEKMAAESEAVAKGKVPVATAAQPSHNQPEKENAPKVALKVAKATQLHHKQPDTPADKESEDDDSEAGSESESEPPQQIAKKLDKAGQKLEAKGTAAVAKASRAPHNQPDKTTAAKGGAEATKTQLHDQPDQKMKAKPAGKKGGATKAAPADEKRTHCGYDWAVEETVIYNLMGKSRTASNGVDYSRFTADPAAVLC